MNFIFLFVKIIKQIQEGTLEINIDNKTRFIVNFFKNRIIVEIFFYEVIFSKEKINFFQNLKITKEFARLLADNDITIIFVYQKKDIIILGKDANPRISKLFTRSKNIEIKNLKEIRNVLKK